jgi:hypothetical protein
MPGPLHPHVPVSDLPEFPVDQRDQLTETLIVSRSPTEEKLGHRFRFLLLHQFGAPLLSEQSLALLRVEENRRWVRFEMGMERRP